MALTYTQRLIRDAVSKHTVKPWPEPTIADFEARIFTLEYEGNGTSTRFPVLALDSDHARELAPLAAQRVWTNVPANAELTPTRVIDGGELSAESRRAMLETESAAEWQHRQDAYQRLDLDRRR